MRLFIVLALAATALFQSLPAQAQSVESRLRSLEERVADQEYLINSLYDRVDQMDRRGPRPGPRRPRPGPSTVNCLLVDSYYSKSFLGSAATQIDAEFAAREACQKSSGASNCQPAVKCDSTADVYPASGAVCLVTDSYYSKSFRGEGATPVAAEAAAKISCQSSSGASNCGKVKARCELKR